MGEIVKQILTRPVQLADQVSKYADSAIQFRAECLEIKTRTTKLAELLRQAARSSNDLYERPTRRIIDDTEQALEKALSLVDKCCTRSVLKRVFTIIPSAAFRKTQSQLDNSIGDVSWLLRVSSAATTADDDDDDDDCGDIGYLGLPPIASNEPILCLIWEQIANLSSGTLEDRADGAAQLVSLARDNDRYGKLIIEEGGVGPLLKLAKEGRMEGQENAARAIGLLGRDQESVEQIVNAGVCSVFAKILKEGHMKVQLVVAWAVSELVKNYPKCQDHFAQANVIRLLVSHLAFETIPEHSKYTINRQMPPKMSIHGTVHSMVVANNNSSNNEGKATGVEDYEDVDDNNKSRKPPQQLMSRGMHGIVNDTIEMKTQKNSTSSNDQTAKSSAKQQQQQQQQHAIHRQNQHVLTGSTAKGREFEDPRTKADMKAMSARALCYLSKGNVSICRSICESRALLCFATLLEKGRDENVRWHSSLALMEITAVAEQNSDLRRTAFKPTSPTAKSVVEQFLNVVTDGDHPDLLIPSIRSIGHLARTFRATETRIVTPLVKLLDEREPDVMFDALIALLKFACTDNYLHIKHCKSIIEAGGLKHLIQLAYFGEQMVQVPALILLCYIALHVPDSKELAQEEVLIVLEWALKQNHIMADDEMAVILPDAKGRLELYQSRGSRGLY